MFKAVKLRLYPNEEQKSLFEKNAGCTRFIYNYFLDKRKRYYEETGKTLPIGEMSAKLTKMKQLQEYEWLQEVDSQSLVQALRNLDAAYKHFFRRVKQGETPGFPKFKSKGNRDRFQLMQTLNFDAASKQLRCSKHGWIKARGSTELLAEKKIRSITVSKEGKHWYASCLIAAADSIPHIHEFESCGINVDVKRPLTVVYSNGVEMKTLVMGQKFSKDLTNKEIRRKRYQRQLARKQKESNNRKKARIKLAVAYQREANFRKNWIEQTSHKLASTFKTIVFEDLQIQKMTKNEGAAKNKLNDGMRRLGLSQLMLRTKQKSAERSGNVVFIDPACTSQTCNS